jgi:hypothetical protein
MTDTAQSMNIQATTAAYNYAVRILINEFHTTDMDEVAGVAAAYALEFWAEWLPGNILTGGARPIIPDRASATDSLCLTPGMMAVADVQ